MRNLSPKMSGQENTAILKSKCMKSKYKCPEFLLHTCKDDQYQKWLHRKAVAHVKRDRSRGIETATISKYKKAIHEAVKASNGYDAYTGKILLWDLLGKYDNEQAKKGRRKYKKEFWDLPTVDHVDDGENGPDFKICSWQVNDAKSNMSLNEFVSLCKSIVEYNVQE